jgi:hypothetical protein
MRSILTKVLVVVAIVSALLVGVARAADQRLTDAQANLEKARALVVASSTDTVSEHARREFDKHRAKAVELIDRATAEIDEAKVASDNG